MRSCDDRRSFLVSATATTLLVGCSGSSPAQGGAWAPGNASGEDAVTPAEDLMREHGILRRVMLIYETAAFRLDGSGEVPFDALAGSAGIIRRVIENYHEKLEENLLFPRFEKAGQLTELTAILRRQHQVGRTLTDQISAVTATPRVDRAKLATVLRSFNHMYRAHAAREDTVLFPAIRKLVGAKAYAEMGEEFEDKEKSILGDQGFEHAVDAVATLEAAFGLNDLARLTP